MPRKKEEIYSVKKPAGKAEREPEKPKRPRQSRSAAAMETITKAKETPRNKAKEPPRTKAKEKRAETIHAGDLRMLIRRKPDMTVILIAVLTAVFEILGMLLASAHTQSTLGIDSYGSMAVIVPLGLLTTLVLPLIMPMDALLMALVNFICGVGIVTLSTVSPLRGVRQVESYVLSILAMILTGQIVIHLKRPRSLTIFLMIAGIGILILPLLFGKWNNGAKNWVSVPLFGSFQPSELVKVSVIFALAYSFSTHRTLLQMIPALLFSALCLLILMLQRDLGTALIYYLSTLIVFYIACGNIPLTLVGVGGGVGAAILGYQMFAHVKVRVAMWRNPWSDPTGSGYQIIQALLAIGSGGLFGVGLGQGTPEKIPEYYNDFIFAVICEQFGQVFGILLILVYLLIILRGAAMVGRSRTSFNLLLGYGALAMFGIQTFMITAGVIKLIPLTGVTMPFLSYGGSSMLSCMSMVGVLHGIVGKSQLELEEDVLIKGRDAY